MTPLESKTPNAAPVAGTLKTIAADYGRLAAAGRANKPAAWKHAFNTVKADENTLRTQLGKL